MKPSERTFGQGHAGAKATNFMKNLTCYGSSWRVYCSDTALKEIWLYPSLLLNEDEMKSIALLTQLKVKKEPYPVYLVAMYGAISFKVVSLPAPRTAELVRRIKNTTNVFGSG